MRVWMFSTNMSITFLILKQIERDIVINVQTSSYKYPLILSDLNEI
jgi:hypothetical protein